MNDELLPYTAKMADDMVLHPLDAHRGDQPRAGHHLHADRQPGHRPAVPRGVDELRPRQPQPEPADVRRHGRQADQPGAGAGDLGPAVAVGLPAGRARGRVVPRGRRPDPLHQQPAGRRRATCAARRSTASTSSTRSTTSELGDPETQTRIAQYEMAFRMQIERAGTDRPREGAEQDARHCTAPDVQEARHVRQHGADGPPAGRDAACASCRSTTTTGTTTATSPAACPTSARTSISRAGR